MRYLYIQKYVCLSVGSAPGHDRDLRLVWPQVESKGRNFPEKRPVAKLLKKNVMSLTLFFGKILLYIFAVHFERIYIYLFYILHKLFDLKNWWLQNLI
jgi:hypothetical protein